MNSYIGTNKRPPNKFYLLGGLFIWDNMRILLADISGGPFVE